MARIAKIAISLPEDMLNALERERKDSGESRSQITRRAIDLLLRQRKEREMSERYLRAYRQMPETDDEIKAARDSASTVLGGEPW